VTRVFKHRAAVAKMKKGVVIINTSRGALVSRERFKQV
jgi:phosphoglycerate dehydrogenase-like enzyme